MIPEYSFEDSLGEGRIKLHLSQLFYTGFNHLNILVDPFTLLSESPIHQTVRLGMTRDYCERTSTKGVEINVFMPKFLVSAENRNKLALPDYAISLEEEPKNEANLPKSKARELLATKEKEYSAEPLNSDSLMNLVRGSTLAEATQKFFHLADRVHLFKCRAPVSFRTTCGMSRISQGG